MDNKNKKLILKVNGQVIDTNYSEYSNNLENKKTIIDQTNPLLEWAKKIAVQLEENKKYQSRPLISLSININKY